MSADRLARVGPIMRYFVDANLFPGITTVIARRGKIVHFETQGLADQKYKTPILSDTIFRLYSMTKPVTAAAVMILYEEGEYFLDDSIAVYLPEFQNMKVYSDCEFVDAKNPLTIRQLLTHTSGLDYGFYPDDPVAEMYRKAGINAGDAHTFELSTADYVKKIASMPLYAEPGTVWRYSESLTVLGRLIEVITGTRLGDFLKERLFHPLGMVDTGFFVPPEKADRFSTLYEINSDSQLIEIDELPSVDYSIRPIQISDFSKQPAMEAGGGGLVSTAPDFLRFAQMLLNGGELDGVRILSPTSVKLMMSNHLGPEFGDKPLASLPLPYLDHKGIGQGFGGLSVSDATAAGGAGSTGEYGWGGAASTDFWVDPHEEIIGMVFAQVVPNGPAIASRTLMHQMTYQAVIES